jgi:hypothetical protein
MISFCHRNHRTAFAVIVILHHATRHRILYRYLFKLAAFIKSR